MQDNPSYKGSGKLTQKMRQKLVSAARCAIRMRSSDPDRKKALNLLKRDLINGPLHCFGDHTNCSSDFCTHAQERSGPQQASSSNSNDGDDDEDIDDDIEGSLSCVFMCVCVYMCVNVCVCV